MSRNRVMMAVLMQGCLVAFRDGMAAYVASDRLRKGSEGMVTAPEDAVDQHVQASDTNDGSIHRNPKRDFTFRNSYKTAGDWLILRSLRSKMCLSPFRQAVLFEFLNVQRLGILRARAI